MAIDPNPLAHFWSWVEIHVGAENESGAYYGFWSGFGSDLTEFGIVVAIAQAARHRNCHVKGCLRFGKPVEGTPYLACHKHHPAHEGARRNVSIDTITTAHRTRHAPDVDSSPTPGRDARGRFVKSS